MPFSKIGLRQAPGSANATLRTESARPGRGHLLRRVERPAIGAAFEHFGACDGDQQLNRQHRKQPTTLETRCQDDSGMDLFNGADGLGAT